MPIYEFQCKKCKHRFEKIQSFSARMPKKCPECGGPLEQLQHAPAIHFKGAGWYVTDYAKKDGGGKSETASAESKSESKPEGQSETKSETKAEATAEGGKSEKKSKKTQKK